MARCYSNNYLKSLQDYVFTTSYNKWCLHIQWLHISVRVTIENVCACVCANTHKHTNTVLYEFDCMYGINNKDDL